MQLALYRAERPEVFEEIIGQKHIVRILQNQIRTGTVSQAYLFAGTHGTGKTSMARILAKAVNCLEAEEVSSDVSNADSDTARQIPCGHCENCETIREGRFVDVVELDAASNNRVEDLRAIIDMVKYPPTVGRYKVYIIDEVHMLSQSAENAFLKTLEEPPKHAIFILATTDPQKVRTTIRSRCMQLNFRRVSEEDLVAGMKRICTKKNINATDDALATIAMKSDGSVRDALSILEQCIAAGDTELNRNLVLEYTGSAGDDFYIALTDAVIAGDLGKAFVYIDEMMLRGKDANNLLKDWLEHYRNLMIVKYVGKPEKVIGASVENIARLQNQAKALNIRVIEKAIRLISEQINAGRYSDRPRILLETTAVRLAQTEGGESLSSAREIVSSPKAAPTSSQRKSQVAASTLEAHKANSPKSSPNPVVTPQTISRATPQITPQIISQEAPQKPEEVEDTIKIKKKTTASGDAKEMWDRISNDVANRDNSFKSLVASFSQGDSYFEGELRVNIQHNKYRFAIDKLDEITKTAKAIYGEDVYVTLKKADIAEETRKRPVSDHDTDRVLDEDITIKDITDEVKNLFDMDINITDN